MGIIEELVGVLFEGLSLSQVILEIALIGGFLYFVFSRYWWKPMRERKAKAAAAQAETEGEKKSEKEA
jgi:hypothetical protein